MNSQERHAARYMRRRAARDARKAEMARQCGDAAKVFSFGNLRKYGYKCCRGVGWKSSTQTYRLKIVSNTATLHQQLMAGKFKSKGFCEFDRMERGKRRHIKSVHISERVVQKCICEEVIVPLYAPSFIYDNSATIKGRGVDFALDRLTLHLRQHYRRHGAEGYVLLFDFSDYFNTAPHGPIYEENHRRMLYPEVERMANYFMECFGDRGFGLGSQVSQIYCVAIPNRMDHYIKQELGIKGYGRYNDDGYLIHESREYLKECRDKIIGLCRQLGINLNEKKTRIMKLNRFTWLKKRMSLTLTGKVIRRANRRSPVTMRRKLKSFRRWMDEGKITLDLVRATYESWRGSAARGNNYKTIRRMDAFVERTFNFIPKGARKCSIKC